MNKYILSILLVVISFALNAQTDHVHNERCGHNIVMDAMENQFPGYKQAVEATFRNIKENPSTLRTDDLYTIPVVVHVVWKETEENISDQLIFDQIEVLNEDFRAANVDFANLRPEFDGIVADPMIEFDLIEIRRVQTNDTYGIDLTTGGFDDNKLKDSANGGSSPADPSTHLNIWVCNIQPLAFGPVVLGQILGYSFPPIDIANYPDLNNWPADALAAFSNPAYDGVVIHYPAFGGRDRTVNDPNLGGNVVFEGRTTVHEIGHYLALRHIWGDGGGLTGEVDCTVDDGIEDTPNAGNNSQVTGCVASKNTCMDAMNDLPDMWENFMDYSVEACQVAFTQGQVDLMRGVLEGPRVDLPVITSANEEVELLLGEVNVSPNPTTGQVSLIINGESNDEYQITVRNILGSEVMNPSSSFGNNIVDMNLSNLSNGVYFIEIQKGNVRAAKKVVLAK